MTQMRYRTMDELKRNLSPDVEMVEEAPRKAILLQEVFGVKAKPEETTPSKRKILEDQFHAQWQTLGGETLTREYRFDESGRKWRFDFAIPGKRIAFEIQGGLYKAKSGHRSKEGVTRDYEKLNAAQLAGWKVFQVTSANIKDAAFLAQLIDFCAKRL
jgi:hypothetical protein